MSDSQRSIPLETKRTPYVKGARFLVIPADLASHFEPCLAHVDSFDGYQAWIKPLHETQKLPKQEEVFLIEFQGDYVLTHRTRIVKRKARRGLVDPPSLTEAERSQLSPFTGRQDYRVNVKIPIQVRPGKLSETRPPTRHTGMVTPRKGTDSTETKSEVRNAHMVDLSRGGLGFIANASHKYEEGETLRIQAISWEYPVSIEGVVRRVSFHGNDKRVALLFPEEMTDEQRETLSAFVIQVQRREALSRPLPSTTEEPN